MGTEKYDRLCFCLLDEEAIPMPSEDIVGIAAISSARDIEGEITFEFWSKESFGWNLLNSTFHLLQPTDGAVWEKIK